MSCGFPRDVLALYVEGDLSEAREETTSKHLAACAECRLFLEELGARQSLLKSLRRETISPSECTGMRREVMSIINEQADTSGWAVRIERAILLAFRRPSYAVAAFGLLGIVSVSALAQIRHVTAAAKQSVALFEGGQTLIRPDGYRDWILVGESTMPHPSRIDRSIDHSAASAIRTPTHGVYISPSGYREYVKTGRFPEGTLMVWESDGPHAQSGNDAPVLLASVKDSTRFDGGWGFFDFTGVDGTVTAKTPALPESSGCRTCHLRDAETDHVFTQFYPALQAARRAA